MKRKTKKQYGGTGRGDSNNNDEQMHLLSEHDDTSDSNVELTPTRPSKRASSRASLEKSPYKGAGKSPRKSSKETAKIGESKQEQEQQHQTQSAEELDRKKSYLRRMDSKVNMFAPEAESTDFADVPAMTVCPHCRSKVVTKTSYSKYKPCCLCCCPPGILSLFKPVRHDCPKCNKRIAKYNRFGLNFKSNIHLFNDDDIDDQIIASKTPSISEEPSIGEDNNNSNDDKRSVMTDTDSYKSTRCNNEWTFSPVVSPSKNKSKSAKNKLGKKTSPKVGMKTPR